MNTLEVILLFTALSGFLMLMGYAHLFIVKPLSGGSIPGLFCTHTRPWRNGSNGS
jgi:hypothetical protein